LIQEKEPLAFTTPVGEARSILVDRLDGIFGAAATDEDL
jgi:hypothetical protein